MASISLTTVTNAALEFLGILEAGVSATGPQLTDALAVVNDLIRNKSYDRLLAATVSVSTVAFGSCTQAYTVSAGPAIVSASIKLANNQTMPLKIVNASEWGQIVDRDKSSYLVKRLFYNRASSGNNVFLSPIPIAGNVEYVTWAAMTVFPDVTTPVTVQDAYARWLKLVSALELAPMYPSAQTPQTLLQNIAEATATLRNTNASLFGEAPPSGQAAANAQPPEKIQPIAAEVG